MIGCSLLREVSNKIQCLLSKETYSLVGYKTLTSDGGLIMYFQQNRTTESFKITLNKQADLIYHFKVGLGQKPPIMK